jgi:hypothetical protein
MKYQQSAVTMLLVTLLSTTIASAHDPELHKSNGEKPKCEAMMNMDHSKMDPNDPVMRAMMMKCRSQETDEMHSHQELKEEGETDTKMKREKQYD